MDIKFLFSTAFFVLTLGQITQAATLDVNSGVLLGASGVDVNGVRYDVEFKDGTCIAFFDNCDDASDFEFSSGEEAKAASQALLDQVFVDTTFGNFDSAPSDTTGCFAGLRCEVITPYGDVTSGFFQTAEAVNSSFENMDSTRFGVLGRGNDTLNEILFGTDRVWAVWERADTQAVVPLPAGLVLLLTGVSGIGALRFAVRKTKLATEPIQTFVTHGYV